MSGWRNYFRLVDVGLGCGPPPSAGEAGSSSISCYSLHHNLDWIVGRIGLRIFPGCLGGHRGGAATQTLSHSYTTTIPHSPRTDLLFSYRDQSYLFSHSYPATYSLCSLHSNSTSTPSLFGPLLLSKSFHVFSSRSTMSR